MKIIQILFALFLGLIGLAMSGCGLFFSVMGAVNAIALVAVVVGVLLLWAAKTLWTAGTRSESADRPPSGGGSTGAGSG